MPATVQLVPVVHRRDPRDRIATATSLAVRRAGGPLYGMSFVKWLGLLEFPFCPWPSVGAERRRYAEPHGLGARTGQGRQPRSGRA
jgi:hypothetical protein